LKLEAVVLSPDGKRRLAAAQSALSNEAEQLGEKVARELIAQGAAELIDAAKR
jgi:porphobilinogen deaminase